MTLDDIYFLTYFNPNHHCHGHMWRTYSFMFNEHSLWGNYMYVLTEVVYGCQRNKKVRIFLVLRRCFVALWAYIVYRRQWGFGLIRVLKQGKKSSGMESVAKRRNINIYYVIRI